MHQILYISALYSSQQLLEYHGVPELSLNGCQIDRRRQMT